jgi:uncharacterized protein with HEPN domain
MLNYNIYINQIIDTIKKIENSVKNKEDLNKADIWDATLMRLQVIGENSKSIPFKIRKKYYELNWKGIFNLRNLISHKYQMIDKGLIWEFINNKIPKIKSALEREL